MEYSSILQERSGLYHPRGSGLELVGSLVMTM